VGSAAGGFYQLVLSDSGDAAYDTFALGHAAVPLHLNNPLPVVCDIAGDVENILLRLPQQATLNIGGNAINLAYDGQNLHPTYTTALRVPGDASNRGEWTFVNLRTPPNMSIFSPLATMNPALGARLSFDAAKGQLRLQGIMTVAERDFLLHPTAYALDFTGQRLLDTNGN